jgi:hypothetical protein
MPGRRNRYFLMHQLDCLEGNPEFQRLHSKVFGCQSGCDDRCEGICAMSAEVITPLLMCELTCPKCGARHGETMPLNACICFYECNNCGTVLRPKSGDCCVFCSYGSVPCPPIQIERAGGDAADCCRA